MTFKMDIKSLNETKKIFAKRRAIALERCEKQKQILMQNEEYASLVKQIKLNTLALSRALANNDDCSEFEKIDKQLNKKLQDYESKNLNNAHLYNCPTCKDIGVVNGKYCDCFIKTYKQVLRNKSGINGLPVFTFKDNKISTIDCKQSKNLSTLYNSMYRYCNEFPNNKYKNIILCGKAGVGKSCLLSSALNELLDKGINAQYFTAFHLNSLFLKYHTTNINERNYIFENLLETEVLIIDDLGIEPTIKNVTIEYLTVLLSERVNKHTIIATNLSPMEMQNKYGDRVFSRITNKDTTKLLYLDGDDLRHISK